MSKKPVYICNRKRCMVCYRTLCGRTVDKEFAELDENGDPKIDHYITYEDLRDRILVEGSRRFYE